MASQLTTSSPVQTLIVQKKREVGGVEMGVLNDGTPYLTQRGLARLCGVEHANITTLSSQWDDTVQSPRVSRIKELLNARGLQIEKPSFQAYDGNLLISAYTDEVCLAILEYYAFEAGRNCKSEARDNFRHLAGKALHDYIYTQVGYDPDGSRVDSWRQYRDRVSKSYSAIPKGYFSVFKEMAEMIVTLGENGAHMDAKFLPDISVGIAWSDHWIACGLDRTHGARKPFDQCYPEYFPQSKSNPHHPWCYPLSCLGAFRTWLVDIYVGAGKFENYLAGKVRQNQLSAPIAQKALAAYDFEPKTRLLTGT